MKATQLLTAAVVAATLFFTGCSPKDTDIQAAIQAKEPAGITVNVNKGEVTLTGEVADQNEKAHAEEIAKSQKGVKSVANNLSIKEAAPVIIAEDTTLTKNVADAVKDFPTVRASVKDGVVTLTGELKKASLVTLMQHLSVLKPKKIENKLTIK